jgi:hypothetical protein
MKLNRIGPDLGRKEISQQCLTVCDSSLRVPLRTTRSIPQQKLGEVIYALAVHRSDYSVESGRLDTGDLFRIRRSLSQSDSAIDSDAFRDERRA